MQERQSQNRSGDQACRSRRRAASLTTGLRKAGLRKAGLLERV
jgi:hypothetical protein